MAGTASAIDMLRVNGLVEKKIRTRRRCFLSLVPSILACISSLVGSPLPVVHAHGFVQLSFSNPLGNTYHFLLADQPLLDQQDTIWSPSQPFLCQKLRIFFLLNRYWQCIPFRLQTIRPHSYLSTLVMSTDRLKLLECQQSVGAGYVPRLPFDTTRVATAVTDNLLDSF